MVAVAVTPMAATPVMPGTAARPAMAVTLAHSALQRLRCSRSQIPQIPQPAAMQAAVVMVVTPPLVTAEQLVPVVLVVLVATPVTVALAVLAVRPRQELPEAVAAPVRVQAQVATVVMAALALAARQAAAQQRVAPDGAAMLMPAVVLVAMQ